MEELSKNNDGCGRNTIPPTSTLWFEEEVKQILGETDLQGLFKRGLYKCSEDTINRFYDYLVQKEPFSEWDESIQFCFEISRLFTPSPSKQYLPYYSTKEYCYCCYCLGWISLTILLIRKQSDGYVFNWIEKEFSYHLQNNHHLAEDTIRFASIITSFIHCNELLSTLRFNPKTDHRLNNRLQEFSTYVWNAFYELVSLQENYYGPIFYRKPPIMNDDKEVKMTLFFIKCFAELNAKTDTQQSDNTIIRVGQKAKTTKDYPSLFDSINNNEETSFKKKDFSKMKSFLTKNKYKVPYEELYQILLRDNKIQVGLEYFKDCISHGDISDIYIAGSQTHLGIIVNHLRKHFMSDWLDSICSSCGKPKNRLCFPTTTKDVLKNEIKTIIDNYWVK